MSWMTAEGSINRVAWRDRTSVRVRSEAVTRLVGGAWVTVEPQRPTMVDWRAGSSRTVQS